MTQAELIADELDRALRGQAWHGSSLSELLDGMSLEVATQRPIPAGHNIGELVLHRDPVLGLSTDRLAANAPESENSVAVMLHGVAQHAAYHGGQIALLKKAVVTQHRRAAL